MKTTRALILMLGAAVLAGAGIFTSLAADKDAAAPAKKEKSESTSTKEKKMEVATLAGGCFWCLDATFLRVKGVEKVVSGYTGGQTENPTYRQVCTGLTGHAEAVQITFDPAVISYEKLLKLFFELHDPTTLNRQGLDEGTQYRSAVYYHDDSQKAAAERVKKELGEAGKYKHPIVTEISKLGKWYPAEDYHQGYFDENYPKGEGNYGYLCRVVLPKVEKLHKLGVELKAPAEGQKESTP